MFTFANPWLFWMLPALALPWIFRRRQEERIRHIGFPLLRFLRESEEKERINPQLQEFLLLILRTLLLALLILSLAGPKWIAQDSAPRGFLSFLPFGRSLQNHLVVIDSSYSMGYGEGERSWWRAAENVWDEIGRSLRGFSVQLTRWDRSAIRSRRNGSLVPLSAVERASLFSAPPRESGTSALELFDAIGQSGEERKNVILITDGQRFPWMELLNSSVEKNRIPPLVVATVGSEPVTNVWCEVSTLSTPPWGIAGWETIAGTIKAISPEPLTNGSISILRSDTNDTLFSRSISYPNSPGQPMAVPFDFTTPFAELRTSRQGTDSVSELQMTLRVEPQDLLPLDNEIQLKIPFNVTFTVGLAIPSDESNPAVSILMSAINPLRGTEASPPVTLEKLTPPNILFPETLDLALLPGDFLSPVFLETDIPPTLDYVKNGGSLLLFTGGETGNNAWQNLLQAVGWQWLATESTNGQPAAAAVGGSGLFPRALSVWDETTWLSWIPKRHGRMEGKDAIPLVTYRIGDRTAALLSQVSVGKGRIWIVNASLNPDAKTLLSPLLPALIWETGKEIARDKIALNLALSGENPESDLTLLSPEEKQLLTERYGIRFADPGTVGKEMDVVYGGTDIRLILLLVCLALALGESWLSNRLASL